MEDKLKGREEKEGGGRQEIIHLHNTALKKQWDALCQGRVTGPRKIAYSGLTSYQQNFTRVGLLDIISVFAQSEKLQVLGVLHQPQSEAAAIRTGATTPDTQFFTPLLTEGELTTGNVWRTINL